MCLCLKKYRRDTQLWGSWHDSGDMAQMRTQANEESVWCQEACTLLRWASKVIEDKDTEATIWVRSHREREREKEERTGFGVVPLNGSAVACIMAETS